MEGLNYGLTDGPLVRQMDKPSHKDMIARMYKAPSAGKTMMTLMPLRDAVDDRFQRTHGVRGIS